MVAIMVFCSSDRCRLTGDSFDPEFPAQASIVAAVESAQKPPATGLSRRQLLACAGGMGLASVVGTHARQAQAAPVPSGVILCRQAWGARPALPGGRPQTITRMTIHHSAVALPDNSAIIARLQQHQRFHQDDRGWVDIAYHMAVDRNGNIFALRDTAIAGDTATNYDTTGHFLVLCEGDFDQETVSAAQLNGAALVFAWATENFGIGVDTLASHQEVASGTACPGRSLQAHVDSGDLAQRITALVSSGFDLQPLCGSQADERVASIEAGG
jgi:hypothetical protein